jgi:hypothetical protein
MWGCSQLLFLLRPRQDAALDQLLDLGLALNAEGGIWPHLQPFGANLLTTTFTNAVLAFLDRPQGRLDGLQLSFKLDDQRDVFLAFDQIRIPFFGIYVYFNLEGLAQALKRACNALLLFDQFLSLASNDLFSGHHRFAPGAAPLRLVACPVKKLAPYTTDPAASQRLERKIQDAKAQNAERENGMHGVHDHLSASYELRFMFYAWLLV